MVSKNVSDGKKYLAKIGRDIIHILLLFSILRLSLKTKRALYTGQITSGNIFISSELITLPERLCYVWVSTRDVVLRKYNLPCNSRHRYGLNLQTNRKISHAAILLLLAGDIATNPGPTFKTVNQTQEKSFKKTPLKCLLLNARSFEKPAQARYESNK